MRIVPLEALGLLAIVVFAVAVFVFKAPRPGRPRPDSEVRQSERSASFAPRVIKPSYAVPAVMAGTVIAFGLAIFLTDLHTGYERGADTQVLAGAFFISVLLYAWSAFKACRPLDLRADRLVWGELTILAGEIAEIRATHVVPRIKAPEPIVTLELRNPTAHVIPRNFFLRRRSRADIVLCPSLLTVKPAELKKELFARYGAKAKLFEEW